jgi:transposase InsO family protein
VDVQQVALELRTSGYRPITQTLHQRKKIINHKVVLRLLKEDNLLCRPQRAWTATTDSDHHFPTFPNLARTMAVTAINQLWVGDITYIRLRQEFIYLAILLDAFSRRCIGWALARYLDVRLSLAALQMALHTRTFTPGQLTHHSDRGVQYACHDYVTVLRQHQITISMSRIGNPYDNAIAERFMRTLKHEEIYLNDYDTFAEVFSSVNILSNASTIRSACTRHSVTYHRWLLRRRFCYQTNLNCLRHLRGALQPLPLFSPSCNVSLQVAKRRTLRSLRSVSLFRKLYCGLRSFYRPRLLSERQTLLSSYPAGGLREAGNKRCVLPERRFKFSQHSLVTWSLDHISQ